MQLETLPLESLKISSRNARKASAGREAHEQLKASLATHGQLHNLVVKKNAKGYEVIDGGRRLRALKDLKIKEATCIVLDDMNATEVSVAANINRADMAPIDEAAAIAGLIKNDEDVASIAARFGRSEMWVRQRMALNSLIPDFRQALKDGAISLGAAQALTSAPAAAQQEYLESLPEDWTERESPLQRNDILWAVNDERISTKYAAFDVDSLSEEAKATLDLRDSLFGDDSTFGNHEEFVALQNEWLQQRKEHYLSEGYNDVVIGDKLIYEVRLDGMRRAYREEHPFKPGDITLYYRIDHRGFISGPEEFIPDVKINAETGQPEEPEEEEEPKEPTLTELTPKQKDMLMHVSARNMQAQLATGQKDYRNMIIASTLQDLRPGYNPYRARWQTFSVTPDSSIDKYEDLGIDGPKDMVKEFLPETLYDARLNNDPETYDKEIERLFGGWAPFMSSGDNQIDDYMVASAIAMRVNPDNPKAMLEVNPISPGWMEREFLKKYRVSQLQQAIAEMGGTTENFRKKDLVEDVMRLWAQGKKFRYLEEPSEDQGAT